MRAAYLKTNGQAHDLRFVADDYVLLAGETELDADTLPSVESLSDLLPAKPNVVGFVNDLKAAMGGIVAANTLAKAYPLFHAAVQQGEFGDVQALVLDGRAKAVLSDPQYQTIKQLAAKHHLPVVLP